MVHPAEAPDTRRRAELYGRIVAEGRRRVRRRRVASFAGVTAVLLTMAGVGWAPWSHTPSHVIITAPSITFRGKAPVSCAGGGPPQPGVARTGMSIAFGWLPTGFAAVSGQTSPTSLVATLGGASSLTQITASLDYDQTITNSPGATATTVAGHPATISTYDREISIDWQPTADTTIELTAGSPNGAAPISQTQALTVAANIRYNPGVTAPSVGDLGPVVPLATVLAQINPPGSGHTDRVVTWLVTNKELSDVFAARGGTSRPGSYLFGSNPDLPLWVVARFGAVTGHTQQLLQNGLAELPVTYSVVNAVTGQPSAVGGLGNMSTLPGGIAALPDHALDQPCPSPSATNSQAQPPLPGPSSYPSGIASVEAQTTLHPVASSADTIEISAGSNSGLTSGDLVTATAAHTGAVGQYLGAINQYGSTGSQVDLITDPSMATPVRLDTIGDDAFAVGEGPNQPLRLFLVNRNIHLGIGQAITTAGPPDSTFPPGIPVGTITSITPGGNGQLQTILVTPYTNPSGVSSVQVLLNTAARSN